MRVSDATGRQVVSTSSATTVGSINDFVIDPRTRAVIALTLKKSAGGSTLPWANITAFGADAVTVSGTDVLTDPAPDVAALAGKDHQLLGKRVLATTGDEIGTLSDIDFDPITGSIAGLILSSGDLAGSRLVGVGSYAVIVHAE